MATSRKRIRLETAGLPEYLQKVNSKEIEGTYGEDDLLTADEELINDEKVKKYTENQNFEFLPLLLNGEQTGYAKCTLPLCQERLNDRAKAVAWRCQQYNRSGLLKRDVLRHLETYHLSEVEETLKRSEQRHKRALSQQSDSSQPSIALFAQPSKKKLDQNTVNQLRKMNAAIIAENSLSLDFFANDAVIMRDRYILEKLGYDPDEVFRFNKGKTALKLDLFKTGFENAKIIAKVAPALADQHRWALLIDHQAILHLNNEEDNEALGIALILSANDEQRYSYLLSFEASKSKTHQETIKMVRQTAKETHEQKQKKYFVEF